MKKLRPDRIAWLIIVTGVMLVPPVSSQTMEEGTVKNRTLERKLIFNNGIKTFGDARLEYHEGIPFIRLSGTYYEMGYQYGILMKDEIHASYAEMQKSIDAFFSLVPAILRPMARLLYNCQASKKEKTIPPHYREELKGFAKAAGLDYDTAIRTIFSSDIVGSLGCTSIVVKSGETVIHGRNLDFAPTALGRHPLVMNLNPQGRRPYTLLGIVGYLPALSGMNDAGISITLNISFLVEMNKKAGMPVGYKIREILESAATMGEIDALLKGYASDGGWLITAASATEKIGAIYEIAGAEMMKSPLPSKFIYVENRYLHEDLNYRCKQIEESAGDYNENRIARVGRLGGNVKSVNDMIALLRDTDYYGHQNTFGKFTVNNFETVQSMVLLPGSGDIYFSSAPMYAGFARMIRYNRNTGNVSVYREADPRFGGADIKGLIESADLFYTDPKRALKEINPADANLLQIAFAYQVWSYNDDLIDIARLVPSIDRWLVKYPDDANLSRIKGHALLAAKRYSEAIAALESGLKSKTAAPADVMNIHALLAKAYKNTGQKGTASQHAGAALDMLVKYRLNDNQKKLKCELERIR